jgi:hypothetical protein
MPSPRASLGPARLARLGAHLARAHGFPRGGFSCVGVCARMCGRPQDRVEEAIDTFARLSGPHAFHGALARAGSAVLRDLGAGAGAGVGSTAAGDGQWADLQMQVGDPEEGETGVGPPCGLRCRHADVALRVPPSHIRHPCPNALPPSPAASVPVAGVHSTCGHTSPCMAPTVHVSRGPSRTHLCRTPSHGGADGSQVCPHCAAPHLPVPCVGTCCDCKCK